MVISPDRRPSPEELAERECVPDPVFLIPCPLDCMGPLKRFRLRLAKRIPPVAKGLGDPGACGWGDDGMPSLNTEIGAGIPPLPLTRRKLEGKESAAGGAGSTLTEWWGEWPRWSGVLDVDTDPLELVDEVFEWV